MKSDTRKLLITGGSIVGTGCISALLMLTTFGGVTREGPHTNLGWLTLMLAMGSLPMGTLTLLLAFAKLVGDRRR